MRSLSGIVLAVLLVALTAVGSPVAAQVDPGDIDVAPIVVQVCCANEFGGNTLIWGQSWEVGDEIDLFINDEYVGTSIAEPNDVGSGSPRFDVNSLGVDELSPDDEVTFVRSADGRTEIHVVTSLNVSRMDVVTDTVTGSSQPGSEVVVFIPNTTAFRSETADAEGDWIADFSLPGDQPGEVALFDIEGLTEVAAAQFDADGNATLWLTTPGAYAPIIAGVDGAHLLGATGPQVVSGQSWGIGEEVELFLNGEYVATSIAEQNGEGSATPWFDLSALGVAIVAGDEVALTLPDASRIETHTVTVLSVTMIDVEADTVGGEAAPGSQVIVGADVTGEFAGRIETANGAGEWLADFSQPGDEPFEAATADLGPTTLGIAAQFDDSGNQTAALWKLEALAVSIDIKPGSFPNSLNIDGHGVIPVAVLGSENFDVTQIDTATLDFAGLEVNTDKKGKVRCSLEDASGDFTSPEGAPDGYLDLVCQFIDEPVKWNTEDGTATLTGRLLPEFGGLVFAGSDVYRLVPEARCTDPLGCAEYGPGDPIVIGAALALSGGLADLGTGELQGTQLAVLQRGDLFGRPLAVAAEDAQCGPDGGAAAATALVGDPAVVSVVGTTCSGSAFQAAPIITAAGYSMVSPSNTAPGLTDPGTHEAGYLRVAYNDLIQAQAMGEFARAQLDASTAAIIRQDDPYGQALSGQFAETFTGLGGVVLAEEVLDTGNPNVETAVADVIAAGSPDLIYLLAFEPEGSQVVIAIRNQPDLDASLIASSDAVISVGFLTGAGTAAEGVYATAVAPPSGPAYDSFAAAYESEFGEPPASVFDAYAFDATNMILDAVADVGSEHGRTLIVGRQQLRDTLFATSALQGVTGAITCSPYGDCAAPQAVQLWQVTNGAFEYVLG